jgi:hypothetical protein
MDRVNGWVQVLQRFEDPGRSIRSEFGVVGG